ncbi:hypothetical protein AB8O55_11620 [Saccharopolyspora cebuensis]|uniref:Uncharacterized protein n=1 Tax=Saccharopolyspora cebuensis TaxID=418759 RepID=A0ABV4CG28_9PSEU
MLGIYYYLLKVPATWDRLSWPFDHEEFLEHLDNVRVILNALAHFSQDPVTADQIETLQGFVRVLRALDHRG